MGCKAKQGNRVRDLRDGILHCASFKRQTLGSPTLIGVRIERARSRFDILKGVNPATQVILKQ